MGLADQLATAISAWSISAIVSPQPKPVKSDLGHVETSSLWSGANHHRT